tara:strand:- start:2378 stop:3718 length:1341 start_codon:yes stop_codon:yes gene_type:complete
MKKHILVFFIFLALQIVNAKEAKIFLKQVELEKVYTAKVTNFLDKMFDSSDYYVFADVQLVEKSKEEEKVVDKKKEEESQESSDPFGYTFIEGLGLDGGSLPTIPGGSASQPTKKAKMNDDDEYIMTGLKISVYLSENIYNVESRETITNFVNTNIQEIRNCFDCFVLDKMPSKYTSKNSENLQAAYDSQASAHSAISALRDSLKWAVFQQEQKTLRDELARLQENDSREIELLERQIDEATSAREFWEDQEARRKVLQNNLDSLKFISLIEIEKEYRAKTNELLDNMTSDYEQTVQARLDDAKDTEERLFSLLESNSKNTAGKGDDVELESWTGTSGFGLLPTIVIIAVVLIAIVLLILKLNKKKVVYLKPKHTPEPPAPQSFTPPPTESNENADVMRSEIRSLRQSAVTMSAGQRDGASQIISDWLDESSGDGDSDDNTEDKEA